jgi:hypothetical protein
MHTKMTTKETLVQRDVFGLVATCLRIASANPRYQGTGVSPLTKAVRSFSRALESMESEEVMAMAKDFYGKHYLSAMGDDAWIENSDLELLYGDDVDAIRLRITQYARVAKELKGDEYDTMRYQCLRLVQRLATKAVAENLDEKILPLEKKLGKTSSVLAQASSGNPAGGVGGIGNIVQTLMSAVGPMMQQLTGDGDSPLKNLLANPNTATMMRNMTSNLPEELQKGIEPMLEDIQQGTFDFSKVLERAIPGASSALATPALGPVDLIRASPSSASLLTADESTVISTSDVVIPTLPENVVCEDGVCYATDA